MKIISWNTNGIRALVKKVNLCEFVKKHNPDILCFNEIKCQIKNTSLDDIYKYQYWNHSTRKKGYSGVAILSRIKPLKVKYSPIDDNDEGRLIMLEFKKFYLINTYVPNSGERTLRRLEWRTTVWDVNLKKYMKKLDKKKPVILTCDLNVAHNEIDIWEAKGHHKSAGFTPEERNNFSLLLKAGFTDTFRKLHPKLQKFSYWSYRARARPKNKGWRLDYFVVSNRFMKSIKESNILTKQLGSDHAPIYLNIT